MQVSGSALRTYPHSTSEVEAGGLPRGVAYNGVQSSKAKRLNESNTAIIYLFGSAH